MEKDLIFFGENGITDTKANNIADLAKLSYTDDETELYGISFVDEKVETIDGERSKDLAYGTKNLSDIEEKVERIGKLKSLCAWLREAVAAHQRIIKQTRSYSVSDYCSKHGIEYPDVPVRETTMTEDDAIASFDIKKRNRYYYLEAQASTIGQFIHKNGAIDSARKFYYEKMNNPRRTSGSGLDTLIYTYSPSIEKERIEDLFYTLQQKHATFQSELNQLKSEIKSRVMNDEIEKNKAYEDALKEYTDKSSKIHSQYSTWQAEELKRVSALKIVIPNALKDIYESIALRGKKN